MYIYSELNLTRNKMDKESSKISSDDSSLLIKPINKDVVHRICSGQVITNLANAIKELVENSIDAGATIIDIRLKEYGLESIEVCDNGDGVLEKNFQALTLKHYTSKIKDFNDLTTLDTLGFRGEALSSMCALSNMVITTKHRSAQTASRIVYDHNGHIQEKLTVARESGTTVTLENLFSTLPVRRKEFIKNIKRDFSKMCQLLYAYCLVSKGIKFTCTNIPKHGNRNTVVATDGSQTIRENIINIFGAKQISTLIEVEAVIPDEPIQTEFGINLMHNEELPFSFELVISSIIHGSGRSTTDRQFYFINGRPCEPVKLSRLVNEIYKQFNSNQYPFIYLNITTKSLLIDVNVTPDKRQIFLENEKTLLATVKASLLEHFKTFPSSYKLQNLELTQPISQKSATKGIKRSITDSDLKKSIRFESFTKRSKTDDTPKKIDLSKFIIPTKDPPHINSMAFETNIDMDKIDKKVDMLIHLACKLNGDEEKENVVAITDVENKNCINFNTMEISLDKPAKNVPAKNKHLMNISLDEIKGEIKPKTSDSTVKVKFRSEIKPEYNKSAEEELQKQLAKEDFANMEIIGQFNLGFIITKLDNDLFIVDQHATDEKYNFVHLQKTTVIDSQVLVSPKSLELPAESESLLLENLEVFRKNGFSFKIDHTAPSTKKIRLTAIPTSRNFVCGKGDIDEMLFILQETGNPSICRPSRVRTAFASKACRKSVMIGRSLSKPDMRRLIDHMGEIEQPWNCPHGRPTIRHLINLDLIDRDI